MKRASVLLITMFIALSGAAPSRAETVTLTLEQAVDLALQKNRDVEKAKEYARYVEGRYVEERSAALPKLSLDAATVLSKDESMRALTGTAPRQFANSVGVSLSQPLFTWGKVGAAIRAAEVGLKTAGEELRLYRQAVQRDVTAAWYDVLLARELDRLAKQNLEQKKRHADEAQKKFAAGVATDYDVLAAEVALENARPEAIRTGNTLASAKDRLRFLLAVPQEVEVAGALTSPDPANAAALPLEEAVALARNRRPELADLRLNIGIYRELVTIAAAEDKPRLDFKGGFGWQKLSLNDGGIGQDGSGAAWSAGIYLSFPFFDGLKTRGKVTQAKSELRSKELEELKLLDAVALEVRDAGNALEESLKICQAVTGTVRQAERLLQMAEKGYEYGVKIRLEVEDAQLNLLQAQSSLARAQRDYRVARANYDWAIGVLGE